MAQEEKPYWVRENQLIAPIKPEYVLWDRVNAGAGLRGADDDAAEGRTAPSGGDGRKGRDDNTRQPAEGKPAEEAASTSSAPAEGGAAVAEGAKAATEGTEEGADGEAPAKKVRLSGAQKKKARLAEQNAAWEAKRAAKAAAGGATGGGGGSNKGRKFDRNAGVVGNLCAETAKGGECTFPSCKNNHDVKAYLAQRGEDLVREVPAAVEDLAGPVVQTEAVCPAFQELGYCPMGFKCRLGKSHMRQVGEGEGFQGCGWELVVDKDKFDKLAPLIGKGKGKMSERGEYNVFRMTEVKKLRGQGEARDVTFPLTTAYFKAVGEDFETRDLEGSGNKRGWKGQKRSRDGDPKEKEKPTEEEAAPGEPVAPAEPAPAEPTPVEPASVATDVAEPASRSYVPDKARFRPAEKRRLDFKEKLYLAPLTTVGNLPFRRLCVDFKADITCSEMGLSQEFLAGNMNEYSLLRRHPSEKVWGVQICGSKPQTLVPTAEMIAKNCDVDFVDVNCGCPIDLIVNKGGGSALMGHATKLGRSLLGMNAVLGDIPVTIKIRTGLTPTSPVAHKLAPRIQNEWGVSAMTLHGRSRQQRYRAKADWSYIGEVVKALREATLEEDEDLPPIPIMGNGDAYDYRTYQECLDISGVDGVMVARGALVKPWLFTEFKERRDWDISSRERLDMIGKLANYGMEHWGTDTMGLNTTRRFLCEALSFQYRYVPIGLLDHLPISLNDRPFPYKGRDELETLLASDKSSDWVKISEMFLGKTPEEWHFLPKHKSNSYDKEEVQG